MSADPDPPALSGPAPERLAAFGRWLSRERELRGLSRGEVARTTRLAPGVVEALESGDPGRLPAHAYTVGQLRAYAAAVGLDPDEAVLRWEEALGAPSPAGGRPARPAVRWLLLGAVLLAVAFLALALLR